MAKKKTSRKKVLKEKSSKAKVKRVSEKTKVKKLKTSTPKILGEITHFYDKISVAVVRVNLPIKLGDAIKIEGHGKFFTQKVTSMQIEHKLINLAKKGTEIGLKVNDAVREKDLIYSA